jgi:tetratricopeptide (TPR) repeat protein
MFHERRYVEAQETIRQLSPSDIGSDRGVLGRYYLMLGKAGVGVGANDVRALDQAIEIFRSDNMAAEQYGDALLWKGLAYRQAAKFREACQEFRTASTWFNHLGLREQEAMALDSIGYCAGQTGNIKGACAAYEKAIELFRAVDSRTKARASVLSLARLHVNIGRLRSAKDLLAGCPVSTADAKTRLAPFHQITMGMILTQLGRYEDAAKVLNLAKFRVHLLPSLRAIYLQERGRLRYYSGEYKAALKAFGKAHEIAGDESDMACGLIRWTAECCLALKQVSTAKGYADHALALATARGDRWIIAGSKRVLAGVWALKGDTQPARRLYRMAIEEFEQIGHEYELAITRQRAAWSGLFGDAQAGEWLNQAVAYFDREGVTRA